MSTVRDIIRDALLEIGVLGEGETPSADAQAGVLRSLNRMLSGWSTENLLLYEKVREEFTLVAGTAAYTIGESAATFNTVRPITLEEAKIEIQGSNPFEVPLNILNIQEYAAIALKGSGSNIPTDLFLSGSYPNETMTLYPVPAEANKLVLYSLKPFSAFAAVSDSVSFPPGYEDAIINNLALKLCPSYGKEPSMTLLSAAMESKANIKRKNIKPVYLTCDQAVLGNSRSFNIYSGEQMRFLGFIGPSYTLKSVNVDCQRCINLYPEVNELGTGKEREVAALLGTPGLQLLATIGDGPHRGSWFGSNGVLYVVSKNKLYSVSSSWVATELGTLQTNSGQVSMADNGIHLMIVDGSYGYVLTFSGPSFVQITDEDFPGADQVTFQDGYFIFNIPGTGQFGITGLNDVTFDALDIATSEGNPDDVVAVLSDHRDLWIFNEKTIEVFFNSGNADFPFERIQGAYVEHGCAAPFSVTKMNNTVYWLGQDDHGNGMVFMASGYQPQKISTLAIDLAIQSYGDVSDAVGYSYQENGHYFYVLNFTSANTTWVFDATTNLWHERTYNNDGVQERHRANNHAFAYSTHVVGDYQSGKLYKLSSDIYADNGVEIIARRRAPHISEGMKRLFHSKFQLDMEPGTGLDGVAQGTNPKIMLRYSDDGGHTWSNEKWTDLGKIGERKKRAIWNRLGSSRDRVYEITISDPVKRVLIGAEIDIVAGVS